MTLNTVSTFFKVSLVDLLDVAVVTPEGRLHSSKLPLCKIGAQIDRHTQDRTARNQP